MVAWRRGGNNCSSGPARRPRALAQEIARQSLPQQAGQPETLDVDALVVAVEHQRVLGVRDPRRVQAEPVGGNAAPAEVTGIGGAGSDLGDETAAGHSAAATLARASRSGVSIGLMEPSPKAGAESSTRSARSPSASASIA